MKLRTILCYGGLLLLSTGIAGAFRQMTPTLAGGGVVERTLVSDGVQDLVVPCNNGSNLFFHGVVWPRPDQTHYHAQFIASVDTGVVADVSLGLPLGYEGSVNLQEGGEYRYDVVVDVPGPVNGPVDPWVAVSFWGCGGTAPATPVTAGGTFGPLREPYPARNAPPPSAALVGVGGAHIRWLQVSAYAP